MPFCLFSHYTPEVGDLIFFGDVGNPREPEVGPASNVVESQFVVVLATVVPCPAP